MKLLIVMLLFITACSSNTIKTNRITKTTYICDENGKCDVLYVNGSN